MRTLRGAPWAGRLESFLKPGSLLAYAGVLWAALAVLDPERPLGSVLGPTFVAGGILLEVSRRRPWKRFLVLAVLAVAYSISAHVNVEFRADSHSYFAYLRSVAFDGDLYLTNEYERWGFEARPPTRTGYRSNVFSVGPAVLWSPFYLVAHAYVRADHALGAGRYPADGYSRPYVRSTALGTLTFIVAGATLLVLMMARRFGMPVAVTAVAVAVFASPVVYYGFVAPAMAHGVTFGVAAALLWIWDRTHRTPSWASWLALGAVFGLVLLCRWQGAVYLLLIIPLAVRGLASRRIRWKWLVSSALAALVTFSPQLVVWKILFGRWVTIPQGGRFLDWSSPHWLDTLIAADHGFFNWTPVMFLGFLGLLIGLRRAPLLGSGSLLVFIATAWVNGSVYDWAAGDAFGARRYSLVVPIMALGLGFFLEASVRILARRPLLAPASLLFLLVLWNLGFISHFRMRQYREMAPLERLARDQARSLRQNAQDIMGWIAGDRGRALAYKVLSGEYFYTRFNRSGTINLRAADERYLLRGWGTRSRRRSQRAFRRALYPEACVRIPLEEPFRLRVVVTARTPEGVEPQMMTVVVNNKAITSARLRTEWRGIPFTIDEHDLVPGENALCLRFSNALPDDGGRRVAAYVERIQLP